MRVHGDGRGQANERITLAPGAPVATPLRQALDLGLDWAARSRTAVALLVLHLSHLHGHAPGPRPHHRRIAANLLEGAVQAHGGQVFTCLNGDLLLLTEPGAATRLVTTLSQLFRAESAGGDGLLALGSLPADEAFARATLAAPIAPAEPAEDAPVPLGAIAAAEAILAAAPVDALVRRQTAVRVTRDGMQPLYQELSVSLAALESRMGTPVPFAADPFLFRHLAARLDRRVLDALLGALVVAGPPLHLNLTLPGILSPGFARLAASLPAGTTLGVEIQFMEAVADLKQFASACARLREAGCRLVLDGVDQAALALARPAVWDPALLKLDWSPRLPSLPGRERRMLGTAIDAFGPDRVVLHRAETEAALTWGRSHGIRRFQGRHVDAMLAAGRISACTFAASCTLRQCIDRAAATGPAGRTGCRDTASLDAAIGPAALAGVA